MSFSTYLHRVSCFLGVFLSLFSWAQSKQQVEFIRQKSDIQSLVELKERFNNESKLDKQKAIQKAKENQWNITISNPNGSFDELMALLPDGTPLYYTLHNTDAANSTRTNHLQVNGSLNLNLTGSGMIGGIWDGGPLRTTHQEFQGRAEVGDGVFELNNNSFHMTHVTGTVAAAGIVTIAKGMATEVNIRAFDWSNDMSEVTQEIINNGLLLSNHSYGNRLITSPTWFVGAYSNQARNWDEIHYAAPYYLMVTSAGNDGNNQNQDPSSFGFDKLMGNKNSKNNLVIANAQDATVTQNGTLINVQISSSSSQGPTDDNRIKPDITGNGTQLFSSNSESDDDYATYSGTSMSGPNVMGSLLLLQQYYEQRNGRYMRSATLKGLVCQTADDAGLLGPDPVFGWGLLNAKAAAETIQQNGISSFISEETLENNESFSISVFSNGLSPLMASITWTDVPGVANSGNLNDTTPALVNDLDIRITKDETTFFPWKLDALPTSLATRSSDNSVDNVERVQIDNPSAGIYTITITHKGSLVFNKQDFSLIVTGVSSNFAVLPLGEDQVICNTETLQIPVQINITNSNPVTLSALNIPEGTNISFNTNPVFESSEIIATLSNLNNLEAGNYSFSLSGNDGSEIETRVVNFNLYSSDFEPLNMVSPSNGATGIASSVVFTWESNVNVESYRLQVSESPNFNTLLVELETTETQFMFQNLLPANVYYWRVIPQNRCGFDEEVTIYSFQTGLQDCEIAPFSSTDASLAGIGDFAGAQGEVSIVVTENFPIAKLEVWLDITHSWVQDLTLYIEGPQEIGSPRFTLLEEACGGEDDILATFSDNGVIVACGQNPEPAIFGTFIPQDYLANFNNLMSAGVWKVIGIDNYNNDGGFINMATLNFCKTVTIQQNMTFNSNIIQTETNSSKLIDQTDIQVISQNQTPENHLYTLVAIPEKGILKKNNQTLELGDTFTQNDVNNGLIFYENSENTETTDFFRVDILNSIDAWLPNQEVWITIEEPLSQPDFQETVSKVYPNPSQGFVTVQMPENDAQSSIVIVDLQGRKILSLQTNEKSFNINLNHLPDGLYILYVSNENQLFTHKINLYRK